MGTAEVRNSLTNWLPFWGPVKYGFSLTGSGYLTGGRSISLDAATSKSGKPNVSGTRAKQS